MDSSEKKYPWKSVKISDDFPTDYDGQISDGIQTKHFVGKTLSVICRKMFRPTNIVGIDDVRENRRELSVENYRRHFPSEISDALISSVNFDALSPSVISEELFVGKFRRSVSIDNFRRTVRRKYHCQSIPTDLVVGNVRQISDEIFWFYYLKLLLFSKLFYLF